MSEACSCLKSLKVKNPQTVGGGLTRETSAMPGAWGGTV